MFFALKLLLFNLASLTLKVLVASKVLCTSQYFTDYFSTLNLIKSGNHRTLTRFQAFKWAIALRAALVGALWLFGGQLSPFANVVFFNIYAMEGLPPYFNAYTVLYLYLTFAVTRLIYFKSLGFTSEVLHQLLIEKSEAFFVSRHFNVKEGSWLNWISKVLTGKGVNDFRISSILLVLGVLLKNAFHLTIFVLMRK